MDLVPDVTVVVLAYGPEAGLRECLLSVLASRDVSVDLVVVDNGCTNPELAELRSLPGTRWIEPGRNTGFAGGCNLGASASSDHLVLLNSDAQVEPDAIRRLVEVIADPTVGLVTGLLLLEQEPDRVNAAGNPIHWSMVSWAGGYGDPRESHSQGRDSAGASGAFLALRKETWDLLGGFDEALFAYLEDAELSMRCWLAGLRVRYEPTAVAYHRYEFARNADKFYLIERNRLVNLLTIYERPTLAALAPGLVLLEAAMTFVAVRDGWFASKRAGWAWIWRNRGLIAERRRHNLLRRRRHDAALLVRLDDEIRPSPETGQRVPQALNAVLRAQGRLARRLLGAADSGE
ncbi:MAG: glycosyltransferase family 2 protein [Candidatus Nanopelagicales bacterium]